MCSHDAEQQTVGKAEYSHGTVQHTGMPFSQRTEDSDSDEVKEMRVINCSDDAEQNERDVSTENTIGMQSAVKVFLNGLLPKNVLVAGLSLRTLSLPLQSGLPMAQR